MQKFNIGAWVFAGGCLLIMIAFGIAIETAGTRVSVWVLLGVVASVIVGFASAVGGLYLMTYCED